MAVYRRSVFLINKKFQIRFSIYVCSWLIALSFVYPLVVHNLFDYFVRYAALDPLGPSLSRLQDVRQEVVGLLVMFQVIFLVISFMISVFMSHRIAGPLYKLTLAMNKLKLGNLREEVRFRTKDHFQDIAEEYNQMLRGLRSNLERNSESIFTVIRRLESIQGTMPEASRAELQQALASLREVREKLPQ